MCCYYLLHFNSNVFNKWEKVLLTGCVQQLADCRLLQKNCISCSESCTADKTETALMLSFVWIFCRIVRIMVMRNEMAYKNMPIWKLTLTVHYDRQTPVRVIQRTRTCLVNRCFTVAGPHLCNSLPVGLHHLNRSITQFRTALKMHLFNWDGRLVT